MRVRHWILNRIVEAGDLQVIDDVDYIVKLVVNHQVPSVTSVVKKPKQFQSRYCAQFHSQSKRLLVLLLSRHLQIGKSSKTVPQKLSGRATDGSLCQDLTSDTVITVYLGRS